jgi:hypothetical protein
VIVWRYIYERHKFRGFWRTMATESGNHDGTEKNHCSSMA